MSKDYFASWAAEHGLQVLRAETVSVPGSGTQYVLLTLRDAESGGQALFQMVPDTTPTLVAEDTVVDLSVFGLPAEPEAETFSAGPLARFLAALELPDFPQGSDAAQRLHLSAVHYVGKLSSAHAPGTDGGNLACAWAVNFIAKTALGNPIGGDLSTRAMYKVVAADDRWMRVAEGDAPLDGDVVISPTGGADAPASGTGHVGFIDKQNLIRSNSSSQAMWTRNYTLSTWRTRYKHLGVVLFRHRI